MTLAPTVPPPTDRYRERLVDLARDELLPTRRWLSAEAVAARVDAVLRVAVLLDVERPGWFRELDVAELDMEDPLYCVLGQLYGWYEDGYEVLDGRDRTGALGLGTSGGSPRVVWLAEVERRVELAASPALEPAGR